MPWVKIEDSFLTHPKAVAAGKDGRALWLAGLLYAARELTDGHIPETALHLLAASAGVTKTGPAITALTSPWRDGEAPLWEPDDGGWTIHDYADYQPSAADVRAKRAKERARKAKGRANQGRDPHTGRVTSAPSPPNVPPGQPPGQATDSKRDSERNPQNVTPVPSPSPSDLHAGDSHVSPYVDPTTTDDETNPDPPDLDELARQVAQARSTRLGGGHKPGWIRSVAAGLDGTRLARLTANGTTDPTDLDRALDGITTASDPTPIHPAIHAAHQPTCPTCDGLRWIDTPDGTATPCPDCTSVTA